MSDTALRKRLAQAAGYSVKRDGTRYVFLGTAGEPVHDERFISPIGAATEEETWEAGTWWYTRSTDAALQLAWNILPPDYGISLDIRGSATMVELREDEDGRVRAWELAEGDHHTPRAICLALSAWLDWHETLPTEDANAALIAAAHNALPALLDELDALRAYKAAHERVLAEVPSVIGDAYAPPYDGNIDYWSRDMVRMVLVRQLRAAEPEGGE